MAIVEQINFSAQINKSGSAKKSKSPTSNDFAAIIGSMQSKDTPSRMMNNASIYKTADKTAALLSNASIQKISKQDDKVEENKQSFTEILLALMGIKPDEALVVETSDNKEEKLDNKEEKPDVTSLLEKLLAGVDESVANTVDNQAKAETVFPSLSEEAFKSADNSEINLSAVTPKILALISDIVNRSESEGKNISVESLVSQITAALSDTESKAGETSAIEVDVAQESPKIPIIEGKATDIAKNLIAGAEAKNTKPDVKAEQTNTKTEEPLFEDDLNNIVMSNDTENDQSITIKAAPLQKEGNAESIKTVPIRELLTDNKVTKVEVKNTQTSQTQKADVLEVVKENTDDKNSGAFSDEKGSGAENSSEQLSFAEASEDNSDIVKTTDTKQDKHFDSILKQSHDAGKVANAKDIATNSRPIDVTDTKDLTRLITKIGSAVTRNESKLTVTLSPENLGRLQISLTESAGKLTAKFTADNESSHKLMVSHAESIKTQLESKGIVIDNMEFAFNDAAKHENGDSKRSAKSSFKKQFKDEDNNNNIEAGFNDQTAASSTKGLYA